MTHAPASTIRSMTLVGEGVLIQLLRRKDVYVLLILGGLFTTGVLIVNLVGVENPATGTFLLNMGLSLAWMLAHILTLVLMARQIPDEIDNRTLYPLLAKPVDRGVMLVGKWLACALCGCSIFVCLALLGYVPAPKMETYHGMMLVQAVVAQFLSIGLLAAVTLLLSLVTPRGVSLVLAGLLFFFGTKVTTFFLARLRGSAFEDLARWMVAYLPDFSKLNLITRYTDGIAALSPGEFLSLCLYAIVMTAFSLALSIFIFKRRAL